MATDGGGTLFFPPVTNSYRIGKPLTIPASVSIAFAQGARLDLDAQVEQPVLTINGRLKAGTYGVFIFDPSKSNPVVFGDGTSPIVHPEWFGGRASNLWNQNAGYTVANVPDSTLAIKAALASLPESGGTIRFSPGQYGISEEIVVDRNGVLFQGGPRQGPLNQEHTEFGSMLVLKNALPAGASMVRFTGVGGDAGIASWGCGVQGLSFGDYSGASQRNHACEAGLHVEKCIAFTMDDCTFTGLLGSALKVTDATQGQFTNAKISRCGAANQPAVWLVDGGGTVQGSVFIGFKVEVCYDAPYVYVGTNNPANKFDDLGFEGDRNDADFNQPFLHVRGDRNQFGKAHFNQVNRDSPYPKMLLDAERCQLDALLFAGRLGEGGGLEVGSGASHNVIGSVIVSASHGIQQPVHPSMAPGFRHVTLLGSHNRIDTISAAVHSTADPTTGLILMAGTANTVGEIVDTARLLVRVEGVHERIGSLVSHDSEGTVLTVTGKDCEIRNAVLRNPRKPGGVIVDVTSSASRCRLGVRILDAWAAAAVRVAGEDTFLLAGSKIENVNSGVGLVWQAAGGGWDGLDVEGIDETGILVDRGSPRRMTRWSVAECNRVNQAFGAFDARGTTADDEGAICTDFRIRQGAYKHGFGFRISDVGGGVPAFQNWTIRGNMVDGGVLVVPKGGPNAVDLDSQGKGDDVTSNSLITLPLTANLVTVTQTNPVATITPSWPGRKVTLLCGTTGLKIWDASDPSGNNIKLGIGNSWTMSADDSLSLVCDGTDWIMVGRTA